MAQTDKPAKKPAPEKKTRTVLSPAEKIAKMEADLQAARDKIAAANRKKIVGLTEQIAALQTKRSELDKKIAALTSERDALNGGGAELTEEDHLALEGKD